MIRAFALAGLAIGTLLWSLPTSAAEAPVLQPEVHTLSDIVTIGDFYRNAGDYAGIPLFRSPDMGTSGDVPAEQVAKRAKAAGLIAAGTNGLTKVVVYRRAETIGQRELKTIVAKALTERDASLSEGDLDITLFQAPSAVHADPSAENPFSVDQVLWSRTDGHFTIRLNVSGLGGVHPLSLTGVAREMVEVSALIQPLSRGAIVRPEDLTTVRLARGSVPARALTDTDEILGLAARSNLRANSPLTRNDFERPTVIPRGEKVTIIYQLPGMKLTTRGQALEDGAAGDVIDIMNLQSRRKISATVISGGQVRVEPSVPVASLNERAQQ
ncbi:flagellar basal body P-ring formation chaperone FlgA [Roseibium sp.]|uniref:flagellar basal body P-ring formation chaperone FlgA n=1 Tax=Roseibium sp. TaxID=1936156 RepID=UPI003A981424